MRYRMLAMLLLAGALTGCAKVNVPPADPEFTQSLEQSDTAASEDTTAPQDTQPETTTTAVTTTSAEGGTTETSTGTTAQDPETEEPTNADGKKPSTVAWADAYARIIRMRDHKSEHIDSYYALIRLDPDKVPELVILDDVYMQLYTYENGEAQLLLEDAYKSSAALDQNVCYQPIVGKFASYFSTMGGGTGYTIFVYDQLDTLHVDRYCFNNNEDEGGEMPYNSLWDRAEEFGVQNNGWNDVTLTGDWIHIGEDFEDAHDLSRTPDADALREEWEGTLGENEE